MSAFSFFDNGDENTSVLAAGETGSHAADVQPAAGAEAAGTAVSSSKTAGVAVEAPSRSTLARYIPSGPRARFLGLSAGEWHRRTAGDAPYPAFHRQGLVSPHVIRYALRLTPRGLAGTVQEAKEAWQATRGELTLNYKYKTKQARRTGRRRAGEKLYV